MKYWSKAMIILTNSVHVFVSVDIIIILYNNIIFIIILKKKMIWFLTLFSLIWPFFPHYPCFTKPSVSYRHSHDLWPLTYISVAGPRFMCVYWACPRSASTWPSSGSSCPTTSAAGPPSDRTTTSWWVFILLYSPYNPRFLWLLPPLLYCDTCHNIKAVVRFGGISSRTCHNIKSGLRVRGILDYYP